MKRWLLIGAVLCVGVGVAAYYWNQAATERQVEIAISTSKSFLKEGRSSEARLLLQSTKPPEANSPNYEAWIALQVEVAVAERQFEMLRRLQKSHPEAVARNVEATSWLNRIAMLPNTEADPEKGQEPLLNIDQAILSGDAAKARQLLESSKFEGKEEVNRLIRLALLEVANPQKAWDYINQAYAMDPQSADVRTFAANLLEQNGNIDLARRDYIGAVLSEPNNLRARDNLAEFYIRQEMLPQAVKTWMEAPPINASKPLFLKAWFWNRIGISATPIPFTESQGKLIESLNGLPKGNFWNDGLENIVVKSPFFLSREEILWLRVLQELKEGKDSSALRLLDHSSSTQTAHHTYLRNALQFLLEMRLGVSSNSRLEISEILRQGHPFWQWLSDHKTDVEALRQPWVLPVLFAVSGWLHAGIDICKPDALSDAPVWAVYTMAQSAQICGDTQRLKDFLAASTSQEPVLQILRAELAWQENREEEGKKLLEGLLGKPEVGYRAASLLSFYYLNLGQPAEVRRVIGQQPDFADSVPGREFLARAALAEGNEAAAITLYETLGNSSDDARIYLARHAFQTKNWDRAESLMRALIADHPNEPMFIDNLEKIAAGRKSP